MTNPTNEPLTKTTPKDFLGCDYKTEKPMNAIISERGNGFCDVGGFVRNGSDLFKVTQLGRIETHQYRANFMQATVEPAADEDCDADDESTCAIELDNADADNAA